MFYAVQLCFIFQHPLRKSKCFSSPKTWVNRTIFSLQQDSI